MKLSSSSFLILAAAQLLPSVLVARPMSLEEMVSGVEILIESSPREESFIGTDLTPFQTRLKATPVAETYFRDLKTIQASRFNKEADNAVQASRRAALESYRESVRLEGGKALDLARKASLNWGAPDTRPAAQSEVTRVYEGWEKKARLAGFEAAERSYRRGYGKAMQRAKAKALAYKGKLTRETRLVGLKAMRNIWKRGGKNVAARAAQAARQAIAQAKARVEEKVAERLRVEEAAQLQALNKQADEEAYQVYAKLEGQAHKAALRALEGQHGLVNWGTSTAEERSSELQAQVEKAQIDELEQNLYGM